QPVEISEAGLLDPFGGIAAAQGADVAHLAAHLGMQLAALRQGAAAMVAMARTGGCIHGWLAGAGGGACNWSRSKGTPNNWFNSVLSRMVALALAWLACS